MLESPSNRTKKFQVFDELVNFNDANNGCQAKGGQLAIIENSEQNILVAEMVRNQGQQPWIGVEKKVS